MHGEECSAGENIQHTSRYLSSSWTVTALRGNERMIFHGWPDVDPGDIYSVQTNFWGHNEMDSNTNRLVISFAFIYSSLKNNMET